MRRTETEVPKPKPEIRDEEARKAERPAPKEIRRRARRMAAEFVIPPALRERVLAIYEENNPDKAARVDDILKGYIESDSLNQLFEALQRKYGVEPSYLAEALVAGDDDGGGGGGGADGAAPGDASARELLKEKADALSSFAGIETDLSERYLEEAKGDYEKGECGLAGWLAGCLEG